MNIGRENEFVEFKQTTGELSDAMEDICAILNKHGKGTLYFGVKNNGEIIGQQIGESTERDISRKIFESIEPKIFPFIELMSFENKKYFKVSFAGNNKPYSCKGIYYIRIADESRVMDRYELIKMVKESNYLDTWEEELTSYTLDDIDDDALLRFYNSATECGRLNIDKFDKAVILQSLGLAINNKINNAGYYLFGKNVNLNLKLSTFATDEKLTFLDLKQFKNNIFNLIDIGMEYIANRINWRVEIGSRQRVEIPEIPVNALREILINSFAHAQFNTVTEHEINVHPNKIVIYNPGSFPMQYTPDDYVNKNIESVKRNPKILDILFRSKDVEKSGSGFKRVNKLCKESQIKWSYVKNDFGFSFIFYRNNNYSVSNVVSNDVSNISDLTDNEYKVYIIIKNNPKISKNVIANKVEKSPRTIQRIINSLQEKGYLIRIGTNKGYWKIIK